MEKLIEKRENEIIELSLDEIISIEGGMEKWMVVGAFMIGFGPGCFALGYYNVTH